MQGVQGVDKGKNNHRNHKEQQQRRTARKWMEEYLDPRKKEKEGNYKKKYRKGNYRRKKERKKEETLGRKVFALKELFYIVIVGNDEEDAKRLTNICLILFIILKK